MRLIDLTKVNLGSEESAGLRAAWEAKGYALPRYDRAALTEKTKKAPKWLHFGAGNIFRAFPAAVLQRAIEAGEVDTGLIVAEGFDYEIIDRAYRPFENLSLLVTLRSDGRIEKTVVGSVVESLKADTSFAEDWARLEDIMADPGLQMVSFTITEKGYGAPEADLARGFEAGFMMGKLTRLMYTRFKAGAFPLTLQSMDNCSHNGDRVRAGLTAYAEAWVKAGLCEKEFLAYVQDEGKVSCPWSMIDKITPRPDAKVQELLAEDGFEDRETIVTNRNSYTAAFVNAEETEYLLIEDRYPNGRPKLEAGGILFTDRETVDKVEKMKVCTCLNPLHTCLAIFGCLLGHTLISAEMKDPELSELVRRLAYEEALPVVVDPGVLRPEEFLAAVLERRFPNPFMPDAPQRIATDTSQKLAIRFGETLKAYTARGEKVSGLKLIPLVLAGYSRYLRGLDDNGEPFEPSPDPLLEELRPLVAGLELKEGEQDFSGLAELYRRKDIFGVDVYELGLGEKIEALAKQLFAGKGAVRATIRRVLNA